MLDVDCGCGLDNCGCAGFGFVLAEEEEEEEAADGDDLALPSVILKRWWPVLEPLVDLVADLSPLEREREMMLPPVVAGCTGVLTTLFLVGLAVAAGAGVGASAGLEIDCGLLAVGTGAAVLVTDGAVLLANGFATRPVVVPGMVEAALGCCAGAGCCAVALALAAFAFTTDCDCAAATGCCCLCCSDMVRMCQRTRRPPNELNQLRDPFAFRTTTSCSTPELGLIPFVAEEFSARKDTGGRVARSTPKTAVGTKNTQFC